MKLSLLFAVVLSLGSTSALADTSELIWEELPESEILSIKTLANLSVGSTIRRYSARVRNCANDISHIMLRVEKAPLYVNGAGVSYSDGTSKTYNFSYPFPADYDSPWIDLDNLRKPGKCVTSVNVNARSTDPQVRSRVKVLGNTGG